MKGIKKMAKVKCENVVIKSVSSADTIMRVAKDRGINPQEVFVRIVFEHEGEEYKASNKLRFIGKTDYEELVKAATEGTAMCITVDTENEYFYIEHNTTVDQLFATPVERTSGLADLAKLLA